MLPFLLFVFLLGLLSRGDLDVLGLLCEDELDVAGVAHVGYGSKGKKKGII